jgi:hypothetical protein
MCSHLAYDEAGLFMRTHLDIILERMEQHRHNSNLVSHLHVLEMFVEKEVLL